MLLAMHPNVESPHQRPDSFYLCWQLQPTGTKIVPSRSNKAAPSHIKVSLHRPNMDVVVLKGWRFQRSSRCAHQSRAERLGILELRIDILNRPLLSSGPKSNNTQLEP